MMTKTIYADYFSDDENSVTYLFGGKTEDLTGLVCFKTDGSGFEVIRNPAESVVVLQSLTSLYNKHKEAFQNRNFNSKISYEP